MNAGQPDPANAPATLEAIERGVELALVVRFAMHTTVGQLAVARIVCLALVASATRVPGARKWALAAVFALLTIGVCAAHYYWLDRSLANTIAELPVALREINQHVTPEFSDAEDDGVRAGRIVGLIRREFAAPHHVMVVGLGPRALRLGKLLQSSADYGIRLTGFGIDSHHINHPLPACSIGNDLSCSQAKSYFPRNLIEQMRNESTVAFRPGDQWLRVSSGFRNSRGKIEEPRPGARLIDRQAIVVPTTVIYQPAQSRRIQAPCP
jgi:AcrR family transcriptional regulator